jgi:Protein of unknown function (DUF2911)
MTDMSIPGGLRTAAVALAITWEAASLSYAGGLALVEMPPRKPRASVSQDVGLTRIQVDYRSPAVRGRDLWGATVPYGSLWRTGDAPGATISFSRNVVLGGKAVPAGTYALIAIPAPDAWTFVLNKNAALAETSLAYQPATEWTRVQATARAGENVERLRFAFAAFTNDQAELELAWGTRRLSIPVKVDTEAQILSDIDALERDVGDVAAVNEKRAEATRYLLSTSTSHPSTFAKETAATPSPALKTSARGAIAAPSLLADARLHVEPPKASTPLAERGVVPTSMRSPATRPPSPDDVAPTIKKGRASIQACYQRALRENPALTHGRVTVSINVGVLGLVKNVSLDAPEALLRAIEPCVRSAVTRWVFPASTAEYSAEVPLLLQGRD